MRSKDFMEYLKIFLWLLFVIWAAGHVRRYGIPYPHLAAFGIGVVLHMIYKVKISKHL
jgi:hypothetical protein